MSRKIAAFATVELIFLYFYFFHAFNSFGSVYLIIPTVALGVALWKR